MDGFDIVGDVHGCAGELHALLAALGHPSRTGRTLVFVGDLVDRGPDTPDVMRTVMSLSGAGNALCVSGNHDDKFLRYLRGRDVSLAHGLARSVEQIETETPLFRRQVEAFLGGLPSQLVLDGGKLVVAHAGLIEDLHGVDSPRARTFALYGDVSGERDEYGLQIRRDWAADYRGEAAVVYGHTPVREVVWVNNTINIDTGCVFGGKLTALRYPERTLVQIDAREAYWKPLRPF